MIESGKLLEGDYEDLVERFYREQWTDGLPVVIPTPKLVDAMIEAGGRDRQEVLGEIGPLGGLATIEAVAINAIMAGCLPEHFPVVLASLEAALAPEHNLTGVTCTTHGCVSLIIVNGPQVKRLGFNYADGVFGNGFRANGAVGRAFRLVCWNLGGARPGGADKSTISHPGEWGYCIAEDEEGNPWEPFHVERGLSPGTDAVTVFACEAPHSIEMLARPPRMLKVLIGHLSARGSNHVELAAGFGDTETLIVLNPAQAQRFADEGWSKQDLKRYIWENVRFKVKDLKDENYSVEDGVNEGITAQYDRWVDWDDPEADVPLVRGPEKIHLLVAGGRTYFAAYCPGWGPFGGFAVTRPVRASVGAVSS